MTSGQESKCLEGRPWKPSRIKHPSFGYEREYYDQARVWMEAQHHPLQRERACRTIEMLPDDIESVLDVGCGSGPATNELGKRFPFVVGLDIASSLLKHIRPFKVQGSADGLPFRDASFDAAVATELIEHLPRRIQRRALDEIGQITRKYVLISVPFREVPEMRQVKCEECGCIFHMDRHTAFFNEETLSELLNPIFSCVSLRTLGRTDKRIPGSFLVLAHAFGGYVKAEEGDAICPQCGNRNHFVYRRNLFARLFWSIPLRILPLPKRPRWMVALYKKTTA